MRPSCYATKFYFVAVVLFFKLCMEKRSILKIWKLFADSDPVSIDDNRNYCLGKAQESVHFVEYFVVLCR